MVCFKIPHKWICYGKNNPGIHCIYCFLILPFLTYCAQFPLTSIIILPIHMHKYRAKVYNYKATSKFYSLMVEIIWFVYIFRKTEYVHCACPLNFPCNTYLCITSINCRNILISFSNYVNLKKRLQLEFNGNYV